ncbi:MAG: RND transporter [Hyphomicrobiaceae bacterium]|nr:hypothetical protein [Hyphomicrobiaceae bacterium]MCC0006809.1 RND transporter [Hyphomicrobiaceae bacterium]
MEFLDRIPWSLAIIAALTLGLAPFAPEPHIWEKLKMLARGTLVRPIDIFDFIMHATPWALLIAKSVRAALVKAI